MFVCDKASIAPSRRFFIVQDAGNCPWAPYFKRFSILFISVFFCGGFVPASILRKASCLFLHRDAETNKLAGLLLID